MEPKNCCPSKKGHLPANFFFMVDFCLCGAILNLKEFCFGAITDIMIELIVYGSVPQSRQSYLLQGPSEGPHNLTSTGPDLS